MTPLCVRYLAPLAIEAVAIRRGAPRATIERIGMGPDRARQSTEGLLARDLAPRPTVLLGVAGGLHEGDLPGEIIVASSLIAGPDEPEIALEGVVALAELLGRERLRVKVGRMVSVSAIVHGEENRRALADRGALGVDMESYWCAPLQRVHPFAVVRVLLDVPGRELRSPAVLATAREAYRSLKIVSRTLATWSPVSVDGYPLPEVGEN